MNMTELVADGHAMLTCFEGLPFVVDADPTMTVDGPRMSIDIQVYAAAEQDRDAIAAILNGALDKLPAEGKWWVPIFPKTYWRSQATNVSLVMYFVLRGSVASRNDNIESPSSAPAYRASQAAFDFAGSNRRRNNE
jgi:hypothetical protein